MKDYNEAWATLHRTVNEKVGTGAFTTPEVLEWLDTIVVCATFMARCVDEARPVEAAVFRHEQMKRITAADGPSGPTRPEAA